MLKIHREIHDKLDYFIKAKKIPNIIFHGASGSGKKSVVHSFLSKIYKDDKEIMKKNTMFVNCSHGGGIKFIREELIFFAKSNINYNDKTLFKSIILQNADNLTTDAQSALRRCIELFSTTSRFFIIVENKIKLLKPILSRFCDIYVPLPVIKNKEVNLHQYDIEQCLNFSKQEQLKIQWLKREIQSGIKACNKETEETGKMGETGKTDETGKIQEKEEKEETEINSENTNRNVKFITDLTKKIYNKGYSGLDVIKIINSNIIPDDIQRLKLEIYFNKIKKEFRNENIFIFNILFFIIIRSEYDLENIQII